MLALRSSNSSSRILFIAGGKRNLPILLDTDALSNLRQRLLKIRSRHRLDGAGSYYLGYRWGLGDGLIQSSDDGDYLFVAVVKRVGVRGSTP